MKEKTTIPASKCKNKRSNYQEESEVVLEEIISMNAAKHYSSFVITTVFKVVNFKTLIFWSNCSTDQQLITERPSSIFTESIKTELNYTNQLHATS